MVKDHSDSKKGNPLLPHGILYLISSKGYFYMHHLTDSISHTTPFVSPVVEHWLERDPGLVLFFYFKYKKKPKGF